MKNIAVFFGGVSCEHDISIITGIHAINSFEKGKYNIFPVYIMPSGKWLYSKKYNDIKLFAKFNEKSGNEVFFINGQKNLFIKKFGLIKKLAKIDLALITCHGLNGEDGSLQGQLEMLDIPYTSSSVVSSGICMDKIFMKQIFEVNNFPVTPYVWFTKNDFKKEQNGVFDEINRLNYPLIVKPANLGSSIGITVVDNKEGLIKAIETALCFDVRVLVEEQVLNLREINCACIGVNGQVTKISELEEPVSWKKFFSFEEKYLNFSQSKISEKKQVVIESVIKNKIKNISKLAFNKLYCSGVVRIDFLINSKTDEVFINEINSIPGLLSNFLFPKQSYASLLDDLLVFAEKKYEEKKSCTFSYDSGILNKIKNSSNGKKFNK